MIPKSSKFPTRQQFLAFRSHARQLITPHTVIYHQKSISAERMAVVVPKKVSKLATTRNFLKRLTYDSLWPLLQDNPLDCVVVYKTLPFKKSTVNIRDLINELTSLKFGY